jgi:XTP/dITP diphosphohydrolase
MAADRGRFGGTPLVVATRNAGKLAELRLLVAPLGFDAIDLDAAGVAPSDAEETVEVHDSFAENARAKARYYGALVDGLPVVADDSGLEVAALGGAPGVRSRRYAGASGDAAAVDAANNARLLDALAGASNREARFVCAVCFRDGTRELSVEGTADGRILERAVGSGGFGYDPLFFSHELAMTFAEASDEAKARVSHRGRALAALAGELARGGGERDRAGR